MINPGVKGQNKILEKKKKKQRQKARIHDPYKSMAKEVKEEENEECERENREDKRD